MDIARAEHAFGRHAESDKALGELIAKSGTKNAFQIAEVHGYRGERDSAFEWLERAYTQRDSGLTMVKVVPSLRTVHQDHRWQPFIKKMRLAE
jgi:hypothetical protein